MTIYVAVASDFTPTFSVERLSDGFVWSTATNAFASGTTYANAKITMTAGTGALATRYAGSLSHANLTASAAGRYRVHIHDDGNSGQIMDSRDVWMREGEEYVAAPPIYHAVIEFTVDSANTRDEYTVTWFKDGARVTSGITSPTIQVVRRSNGADLVASTTMFQIGTTGSYKHDESTNRVGTGEAAVVIVTATIDGATRSFSEIASRDD